MGPKGFRGEKWASLTPYFPHPIFMGPMGKSGEKGNPSYGLGKRNFPTLEVAF